MRMIFLSFSALFLMSCTSAPKEVVAPCDIGHCKHRQNVNSWAKV